jgi:hypothetical protein
MELLGQVITVGAIQVAERTGGFHHYMHAPNGLAAIDAYLPFRRVIRHNPDFLLIVSFQIPP